jgi:hypothetical protein
LLYSLHALRKRGLFETVERTMNDRREKYHAVNEQWPEVMPALTGPEAIAAAKRLFRFGMKRAYKGKWKLTSGRRFTWPRNGVFYVNPNRTGWGVVNGWHDLVHTMSHYCHRRLHPKHKPHDGRHHFLEKEMVAYVIRSGWLDGRLRPKSATATKAVKSVPATKLERTVAAEKRWTTKLRRAETALRKLRKQRRYYSTRVSELEVHNG